MDERKSGAGDLQDLIQRSRTHERAREYREMLDLAELAARLKPRNTDAQVRFARCLWICGQTSRAIGVLERLESTGQNRPRLLQRVGDVYVENDRQSEALRCFARAVEIDPANARCLRKSAQALLRLGRNGQAARLLERAIFHAPADHWSWYQRALAHRQTSGNNHVQQLSFALDQLEPGNPGRIPLCYALAKELDDLGRYEDAFICLAEGAKLRGPQAGPELFQPGLEPGDGRPPETDDAANYPRPVFLVGFPGAETEVVGRCLARHSQVDWLGNTHCLRNAVRWGRDDPSRIGVTYREAVAGIGLSHDYIVDINPLNINHIGYILKYLPESKIVLVHRNPMDACFAVFRDLPGRHRNHPALLEEIARSYLAYRQLLDYWRAALPGRIYELDFELFETMRERQVARLLEHLALPPQAALSQPLPSPATGIGHWQRYARQLQPLREQLETIA